jgi:hypothetical protein
MTAVKKVERGVIYFAGALNGKSVRPEDGKKFSMKEIQLAVGGYFECLVPAERGWTVYCDEEGGL